MRFRNTLVMAVVALLLGGYVWFFDIRGREAREEAERVANRLLSFETADVTGLTIETTDETIVLAKQDDNWRITAPYDLAADSTAVSGLVNRVQSADHDRLIDEQPEDLGPFGLDDPVVKVSLKLADGSSRTLAVGAGTPVGYNVFVQPEGGAVYTTAASLKDALNKKLFDLRDRTILKFTDADVARIQVEADGLEASLRRAPDRGDNTTHWDLTEPVETGGDSTTVSSLLTRLRTDKALAFPSESPTPDELEAWGLAEPHSVVTVWTNDDAAQTLQIGVASEDPAGYYARRAGNDAVFVAPTALVDALPGSIDDLRNKAVTEFARDRVESIVVDRGDDAAIELRKNGINWHIDQPRDLEADSSTVSSLLSGVLALRADEFASGTADDPRFGLTDPSLSIAFNLEPAPGAENGAEGAEGARTVTFLVGGDTTFEADAEGDEAPTETAAQYVAVQGEPTVYVVAADKLSDLDVTLFGLRSKTLLSFDQSTVTRLDVIAGDTTYRLDKDESGTWNQSAPSTAEDKSTEVDNVMYSLNYLRMEGIVAEWEGAPTIDPADYGLASPALRVRAFAGDDVVADVSLGNDVPEAEIADRPQFAPGEQIYVMAEGHPALYRISARLRDVVEELLQSLS